MKYPHGALVFNVHSVDIRIRRIKRHKVNLMLWPVAMQILTHLQIYGHPGLAHLSDKTRSR